MKGDGAATSPEGYIAGLPDGRREEIARLHDFITETAPDLPVVLAHGMIGYGPIHYRYASGRERDTVKIGLASQKNYISIYSCAADENGYVAEQFKDRLLKANIGKGCVRFKRFSDLDPEVLRELIVRSAATGYGAYRIML
ncbi:hypothetical protein BH11ARM2_BH11ARM2_11950 [soil metagenome]